MRKIVSPSGEVQFVAHELGSSRVTVNEAYLNAAKKHSAKIDAALSPKGRKLLDWILRADRQLRD